MTEITDDARFILQVCSYCKKAKDCKQTRKSCTGYIPKSQNYHGDAANENGKRTAQASG